MNSLFLKAIAKLCEASPTCHTLRLNCVAQGDGTYSIFPVKIAGTDSVGDLKKAIEVEKGHVAHKTCTLWKVALSHICDSRHSSSNNKFCKVKKPHAFGTPTNLL
jgi:hypothetical protein